MRAATLKTCQRQAHLPTVAPSLPLESAVMPTSHVRTLKGPRRLTRRRDRRSPSPQWQFLRGFLKHPVMVGSIIPSSRLLIERMLRPVDWDKTKLFVEYGPGVGTFTRDLLDRMSPDAKLVTIDTNPDFTQISDEIDRRSAADRGHRLGRRCRADPRRARVRQGRLCAFGPALLDPAARRRRRHRQGHRQGRPAGRRVPGLSVQPQGAGLHQAAFRENRPRLRVDQRPARDLVLGMARRTQGTRRARRRVTV